MQRRAVGPGGVGEAGCEREGQEGGLSPVVGDDVAGILARVLLEEVDLEESDEEHDLEPGRDRERRPRRDLKR